MVKQIIPFNSTGSRIITIELGENVFRMRTYYLPHIKRWILDIMDSDGNPIIMGITLNLGVGNMVKGKSELFEGQTLRCVSLTGKGISEPDSLGKDCVVVYYGKNEFVPATYLDKMI